MTPLATSLGFIRQVLMGIPALSGIPVEVSSPVNVENAIVVRWINGNEVGGIGAFISASVVRFQVVWTKQADALSQSDMVIVSAFDELNGLTGPFNGATVYQILKKRSIYYTEHSRDSGQLYHYIGGEFEVTCSPA